MDDLGYINARIRGMKGRLLSAEKFEEMLYKENLGGLVESLKGTPYEEFLPPPYPEPSIKEILDALREEIEKNFSKILEFSSGEPNMLLTILLYRFLISNIKAILRGKIKGVPKEEILSAVLPVGVLDDAKIRELIDAESASDALELLITWRLEHPIFFGTEFTKIVRKEDVTEMEFYLDDFYYRYAFEKVGKGNGNREVVRYVLCSWVDLRNIMGTLLILKHGIKPKGKIRYLPAGHFETRHIKFLENSLSFEDALKVIENTRYRKIFEDVEKPEDLVKFERRFEESLTEWALQGFLKDPLSIALPVAYIFSKYNELVNLRVLVYGKYHGISPKEIRKEIFFKK